MLLTILKWKAAYNNLNFWNIRHTIMTCISHNSKHFPIFFFNFRKEKGIIEAVSFPTVSEQAPRLVVYWVCQRSSFFPQTAHLAWRSQACKSALPVWLEVAEVARLLTLVIMMKNDASLSLARSLPPTMPIWNAEQCSAKRKIAMKFEGTFQAAFRIYVVTCGIAWVINCLCGRS